MAFNVCFVHPRRKCSRKHEVTIIVLSFCVYSKIDLFVPWEIHGAPQQLSPKGILTQSYGRASSSTEITVLTDCVCPTNRQHYNSHHGVHRSLYVLYALRLLVLKLWYLLIVCVLQTDSIITATMALKPKDVSDKPS